MDKFQKMQIALFAAVIALGLTFFITHIIDLYRCGGGIIGWADGGHLQSMRGWRTIEKNHPYVIHGTMPGVYYVNTDHGTYATNWSADDDLVAYLDTIAH